MWRLFKYTEETDALFSCHYVLHKDTSGVGQQGSMEKSCDRVVVVTTQIMCHGDHGNIEVSCDVILVALMADTKLKTCGPYHLSSTAVMLFK